MIPDDGMLASPYRAVRAVRAREDAPWPGVLVREAAGTMRLLVDAAELGPAWTGWDAATDGHVLAPVDVARRRDGHDVVLPVCVERLDDFLRRRAARLPLTPGETVTLGVSLLRGCAQIAPSPQTTGEWWLDDAGRPVLATETSARRAIDATVESMTSLDVAASLQRTWDTALRSLTAERISAHDLAAAEDAMFALAAPEPLSTTSLAPRPAADAAPPTPSARPALDSDGRPRSVWQNLLVGVDDDLADSVSRATTAVWRRLRGGGSGPEARPARRRAPWIVGGAVAAAVLAVGALWPGGGPATAGGAAPATAAPTATIGEPTQTAGDPAETASGAAAPTTSADDSDAAGAAPPADLTTVAAALLDARAACAGDLECLAGIVVDPTASPVHGAIDLGAAERTVTLLDDFGDLAVLRVDAVDAPEPSQLVVILRQDEKWLLRDVHDVAQQPEG
ncbi:hypothetical protein IF188_04920 [Microbacterium sp. NEAU-LLC]|uniref:Uncharacterized protein n=1 Tax=Microbacterium helvum TaxID=2773713 RepID=A0ABR8NK43_9MICO|nr:hypothetical protein [Microbacterium helvum]MBD3941043.1 hypothetical protein [Microbacterium helvum]